jgi:hypothetical protein
VSKPHESALCHSEQLRPGSLEAGQPEHHSALVCMVDDFSSTANTETVNIEVTTVWLRRPIGSTARRPCGQSFVASAVRVCYCDRWSSNQLVTISIAFGPYPRRLQPGECHQLKHGNDHRDLPASRFETGRVRHGAASPIPGRRVQTVRSRRKSLSGRPHRQPERITEKIPPTTSSIGRDRVRP